MWWDEYAFGLLRLRNVYNFASALRSIRNLVLVTYFTKSRLQFLRYDHNYEDVVIGVYTVEYTKAKPKILLRHVDRKYIKTHINQNIKCISRKIARINEKLATTVALSFLNSIQSPNQ